MTMNLPKPKALLCLVSVLALAGAIAPLGEEAAAQGGLRAQVWLVQGRIPRLPSAQSLLGYARSHNARRLTETSEPQLRDRKWLGSLVTKFSRPLGDVQFTVLFYDVEEERRITGQPMDVFVNRRDETVFVQRFQLERRWFRPNRKMELVVTVRRQEVGKARFELLGEVPRNSGVVDFTQEGM